LSQAGSSPVAFARLLGGLARLTSQRFLPGELSAGNLVAHFDDLASDQLRLKLGLMAIVDPALRPIGELLRRVDATTLGIHAAILAGGSAEIVTGMSIIDYDLPQGTPSNIPVGSRVSYCGPSDVASLNRSRPFGVGNNPNINDVQTYIEMVAGQIDATLINKGFQVPVNVASYPEAEGLLSWVNATGAWAMMEEASPNSPNVDLAQKAFDAAMAMLQDAKLTLDIPSDQARSEVRAPWVTFTPSGEVFDPTLEVINGVSGDGISAGGQNSRKLPFFSRSLRF
jgi:hypothetical protein